MLPFQEIKSRIYTCFVCAMAFKNFNEFTDHIIQNHEEGREYVRCPLKRCRACVRDVRLHFKLIHKNEPIPHNCQMKAMIWKDQTPKGKLKQRKPKFREGYLISTKNGGKEVHYRSGMECNFYECLEADKSVVGYDVEPFAIKYSYQGEIHEYNPDLSILFDDGHIEIWEVKPSAQTSLPQNQAKWTACQQHCEARGWGFVVMTEKGLDKLKHKIKTNSFS